MRVWVASVDISVGGRKFKAGDVLDGVAEKNLEPMRRLKQAHEEERAELPAEVLIEQPVIDEPVVEQPVIEQPVVEPVEPKKGRKRE